MKDETPTPDARWSIEKEWMSRAEFAEMVGITTDTAARWESRRTGPPCVRLGRKVLYRRTAVHEWLMAKEDRRPKVGGRASR